MTLGNTRCSRPVDTLSIYPTLLELCGLKPVAGLISLSLVPLLKNPDGPWATPASRNFSAANAPCAQTGIVTFGMLTAPRNSTITCETREWSNIAGVEASRPVIAELARWIPKHFAPNAPSKKAYHFDPHTYGWTLRKEEVRK